MSEGRIGPLMDLAPGRVKAPSGATETGHLSDAAAPLPGKHMPSFYDFSALKMNGKPVGLNKFKGRPVLIVNTASHCGFTPQFGGLEDLHKRYGDEGLVVLGFPCNQFGAQDPGSNDEIAAFCQTHYGVGFPMMAKVDVNGPEADPLWRWLTEQAPGVLGSQAIKWNFTKFLVDREGTVLKRYAPNEPPSALAKDIEAALGT
jgi:glutathione peroxidase